MWRIQLAVVLCLVAVGATNILTSPDTVTMKIALPELEVDRSDNLIAVSYQPDPEPRWVEIPDNVSDADRECLAHNIYFEAKNQSLRGQLAVGQVTLKRVADKRFPNTICGVVKHTRAGYVNGLPVLHKCQFSWYCDGEPDRPYNEKAYIEATSIANALLSHESGFEDITGGADHYHADYVTPYWAGKMQQVAVIDDHIFYRQNSL